MKEKVSIIIPVYNCEKYLKKCVDSILNQTYKNFELLLINDGSTDNSLDVCNGFKDKRIKVITKKNGGASSARNVGLDNATGEYIMFVDSDDFIDLNIIEVLYNILKKHKADISICECFKITTEDEIKKQAKKETIYEYTNVDLCLRMQGLDNDNVGDVVWGKLYRKSLFNNLRFVEGMINEDAVLLHELYYKCKKGVKITSELYNYCVFDLNSVSRKKYSYKNLDSIKAYKMRVDYFKDKNVELYINALKLYNTNIVFNYCLVKKYLKDKNILKDMKINIKNNNNILKKHKMGFVSKLKLFFQVHFTMLYSILLNLNLKRRELVLKNASKK